jgi:hypothetical protein
VELGCTSIQPLPLPFRPDECCAQVLVKPSGPAIYALSEG